jgi:enduracididine biosynthesis enzyme MppR
MVVPPPWHFSGDFIWVDCRVDPAAAVRFLPPGLSPGPDPGAAAAVFVDWQWCSASGGELADPVRCQFAEFLILLASVHAGQPVARCPYAWVDRAVPLVRGWIQGMPKQFGAIRLTRPVRAGRAGPRLEAGGSFAASLAAHDRRLVSASVTLEGHAGEPPLLNRLPLVHSRQFPSWDPGDPPVSELVVSQVTDVEYAPVWSGTATLRFEPDLLGGWDRDLASLAPLEVGRGYVFSYGETLLGGTRLG